MTLHVAVLLRLTMLLAGQQDESSRIKLLVEALRSANIQERAEAQNHLSLMRREVIPFLTPFTKDSDRELSSRVSQVIRLIETRETLPPRIQRSIRNSVERMCSEDKHEATLLFLDLSRKKPIDGRIPLVTADDLNAIVGTAFRGAVTSEEVLDLIAVVDRWGLTSGVPELEACLEASDYLVQARAIDTIGRLGVRALAPKVRAIVPSDNEIVCGSAIRTVGLLGDAEAIKDLRRHLGSRGSLPGYAAGALASLGDTNSIAKISSLLKSNDTNVRAMALEALSRLNASESLEDMRRCTDDSDEWVRLSAIRALGRLGTSEDLNSLLVRLKSDSDFERITVFQVLDSRKSEKMVSALLKVACGQNGPDRVRAILLLGKHYTPGIDATVQPMLKDASPDVRIAAATSLCMLGTTKGIPVLVQEGRSLYPLNALRRPEEWKQLQLMRLESDLRGRPLALLETIARRTGCTLNFPMPMGDVEESFFKGRRLGGPQGTRLADLVVDLLEEANNEYDLIVEEGCLVVLRKDDARQYWSQWVLNPK